MFFFFIHILFSGHCLVDVILVWVFVDQGWCVCLNQMCLGLWRWMETMSCSWVILCVHNLVEKHKERLMIILFVVMHVFFLIIVIFLTDFSSLFLLPFYFLGLSTKKHPAGKFFPLLLSCMFVLLLFVSICKVLFLFVVMHAFSFLN